MRRLKELRDAALGDGACPLIRVEKRLSERILLLEAYLFHLNQPSFVPVIDLGKNRAIVFGKGVEAGEGECPLCLAFLGNWSVERKHVRCAIEALYEGEAKYAVAGCLANHDPNGNPVRQAIHKRAVVVLPRVSSVVGRVIEGPGSICEIDGSAIVVGSPSAGMDGEGVPSPSFIGGKGRTRYVDPSITTQGNGGSRTILHVVGKARDCFPGVLLKSVVAGDELFRDASLRPPEGRAESLAFIDDLTVHRHPPLMS